MGAADMCSQLKISLSPIDSRVPPYKKKKKEKKIYFRKEEQQHTRASCVVGLQSSLVMARLCNKETNFYYTVNNDNNLVNVDYIHKVVNSSCGYNKGHDFHLHPAR